MMPFSFSSISLLLAALGLVLAIVVIAAARRPRLKARDIAFMLAGLLLLALAAGGPAWHAPIRQQVAVMVDLSPSTRTAAYRDRGVLNQRLAQLLGNTPYRIIYFADGPQDVRADGPLPELPADRTTFEPPADAAAIVLFSDGRFEPPPLAPPVFAVVDPALAQASDSRIAALAWRGRTAVADVVADAQRELTWINTADHAPSAIDPGRRSIAAPVAATDAQVTAQLNQADPWPENDSLTLAPIPAAEVERWWIGDSAAPPGWRRIAPAEVPSGPLPWLNASVIALDNVAADALDANQQRRLGEYVRDLGGALILLGGDRAFAAGGYAGTALDDLSPLASHPPTPTRHWILLTDASGSMAQTAGPRTRFSAAGDALAAAIARLPAGDRVSVGAFANDLTWWIEGQTTSAAARAPLPPPQAQPRGPTNLQPALAAIAAAPPDLPIELLVLTDGQTDLADAPALTRRLRDAEVRLWTLAIGQGPAIDILARMATETGGGVLIEQDAGRWPEQLSALAQRASAGGWMQTPVRPQRLSDLVMPEAVEEWNRTWLKEDAQVAANADLDGAVVPLLARWQRGTGRVLAAAWRPPTALTMAWAESMASLPQDLRLRLTWAAGERLEVMVDAVDGEAYLNDLRLSIDLNSPIGTERHTIEQTAPGRYAVTLPAPRSPTVVTVRHEDRIVQRFAVAGRYAMEFDAIGIDRVALEDLTAASGGRVVAADDTARLKLPRHHRPVDLTDWLIAAGFICIATGLVLSRR